MKWMLCCFLVVTMQYAIGQTPLKNEWEEPDWISLFDGKSTKGWHPYGQQYAATLQNGWTVEKGCLRTTVATINRKYADLMTDVEFEHFQLKLDWKLEKGSNSGIVIYANENTRIYTSASQSGPEIQIADGTIAETKLPKYATADMVDLMSSYQPFVKPIGEWNTTEIICEKGKLDVYFNGKRCISTYLWGNNWKQAIGFSKYKQVPNFGMFKKGKIALMHQGSTVWYRNIVIKRL